MLTKEKLLSFKRQLKTEEFPIPELGDSILIRELNGLERERVSGAVNRAKSTEDEIDAKMLILHLGLMEPKMSVGELKERYATDYEWMHRAHIRILLLSGLASAQAAEMEKNSQGVPNGKPGSSSPAAPDSLPASSSDSGAAPNSQSI